MFIFHLLLKTKLKIQILIKLSSTKRSLYNLFFFFFFTLSSIKSKLKYLCIRLIVIVASLRICIISRSVYIPVADVDNTVNYCFSLRDRKMLKMLTCCKVAIDLKRHRLLIDEQKKEKMKKNEKKKKKIKNTYIEISFDNC